MDVADAAIRCLIDDPAVVPYPAPKPQCAFGFDRLDDGHWEDQVTIIDPATLNEPWHLTRTYQRVANIGRMVYEDCEGEERNPIVEGKFTLTPPPLP